MRLETRFIYAQVQRGGTHNRRMHTHTHTLHSIYTTTGIWKRIFGTHNTHTHTHTLNLHNGRHLKTHFWYAQYTYAYTYTQFTHGRHLKTHFWYAIHMRIQIYSIYKTAGFRKRVFTHTNILAFLRIQKYTYAYTYTQFTKRQAFGNAFLQKFNVVEMSSPILEDITLIDTPGVCSCVCVYACARVCVCIHVDMVYIAGVYSWRT